MPIDGESQSTGIYLIRENDDLVPMREEAYEKEDLLQRLLADHPDILAGDQMNPEHPRRWLLVRREMGVPIKEGGAGWFALDHLFLDQDGIPTFVEVKRANDTRARREVVAQMLDYAANAVVYWPIETIRAEFNANRTESDLEPSQQISEFLGDDDEEDFWQRAKTNLQAGRVRMVFVADTIQPELRRIVEFLNGQMDPAEVLAVEIKQYVGGNLKTLVPRVIGQTAEAQIKKSGSRELRQWDERSFMEELEARRDDSERATAKKILDWMTARHLRIWWGSGPVHGSVGPILDHRGLEYWLFRMWTDGNLQITVASLKAPFDHEEKRLEAIARLNAIPGVDIPKDGGKRNPKLSLFKEHSNLQGFLNTFDWIIDQVKSS